MILRYLDLELLKGLNRNLVILNLFQDTEPKVRAFFGLEAFEGSILHIYNIFGKRSALQNQ